MLTVPSWMALLSVTWTALLPVLLRFTAPVKSLPALVRVMGVTTCIKAGSAGTPGLNDAGTRLGDGAVGGYGECAATDAAATQYGGDAVVEGYVVAEAAVVKAYGAGDGVGAAQGDDVGTCIEAGGAAVSDDAALGEGAVGGHRQ